MRDSWGTRQRGMLEGNARWMGRYWECVNAMGKNFRGKFCSTYFGFRYIVSTIVTLSRFFSLK